MQNFEDYEGDEPELDALDELDYDDDHYENRILKFVTFGFVIAAIGGFVGLAWYAYQSGMQPVSEDEIPMVEASNDPIKEVPEDPGGMQFDHQDKAVYNQLAAGDEPPSMTVQLLEQPEEPIERPSAEELANTMEPEPVKEEVVLAPEAEEASATSEAESKAAAEEEKVTVVASSKNEEEKMEVVEVKPEPKPVEVAKVETKPAPAKTAVTTMKGDYMTQLGAFRSEADAKDAWGKISKKHGSHFAQQTHTVKRADLGAKGVFYRLQMGPFASDASAREACEYLQGHKQACMVVKP